MSLNFRGKTGSRKANCLEKCDGLSRLRSAGVA
jgi:hypothetical protein